MPLMPICHHHQRVCSRWGWCGGVWVAGAPMSTYAAWLRRPTRIRLPVCLFRRCQLVHLHYAYYFTWLVRDAVKSKTRAIITETPVFFAIIVMLKNGFLATRRTSYCARECCLSFHYACRARKQRAHADKRLCRRARRVIGSVPRRCERYGSVRYA